MRPLRLTMTAFGPYAGTEIVDFDALTGVGLFVVAGNNGAGKTTIFDALHYSLYGMLPGRRATYYRLKSDHADAKTECKVVLEFAAHGKHWRVERTPAQTRAKRRGSGTTEAPASATLFRVEQGGPTAVTNRLEEVRATCTELVGLSGAQFERVALLPQGEFSRVLRDKSTDRRKLLRTLFSSEIFDDATGLIAEQASAATLADTAKRDRLVERHRALVDELGDITGRTIDPAEDLAGIIVDVGRSLDRQRIEADQLTAEAAAASLQVESARALVGRIERRDLVRFEFEAHHQHRHRYEQDLERMARATASVPVVTSARSVGQHQGRQRAATDASSKLHAALVEATARAGLPFTPLSNDPALDDTTIATTTHAARGLAEQLKDRQDTALRVRDLQAAIARRQGDIRRKANEIRARREDKAMAESRLRQTSLELTRLTEAAHDQPTEETLRALEAELEQRRELSELEDEHQQLVARATRADAQLDGLTAAAEAAQQASTTLAVFEQKAAAAVDEFAACERRAAASMTYASARTKLEGLRGTLRTASNSHDHLWDNFVAGAAARVADGLVDDEPCPVCGSCEHPAPARRDVDTTPVTEDEVQAARAHVDTLRDEVRSVESMIEHLLQTHDGLATDSPAELAAETSTAKAMALGAQTVADDARRAASSASGLTDQLLAATASRQELESALNAADSRQVFLRGALGNAAAEPVHKIEARVATARDAGAAAARLASRKDELATTIQELTDKIETIGLAEIASQSQHNSLIDQCAERQADLNAANEQLATHDAALLPDDSTQAAVPVEQRAQAIRQAQDLLGQVKVASARRQEAADAVRRAQSILADRVAASPFSDVEDAMAAFVEPELLEQIEAQTNAYANQDERLQGQLSELTDIPHKAPDLVALGQRADQVNQSATAANTEVIAQTTRLDRMTVQLDRLTADQTAFAHADPEARRLERVAALVKGDNDRNMSLENWVLAAHLRNVVDLANVRLAQSTHQRFQLCVLDDGENRRGKWGLDLGVEDTVTGTRRPAAGLSGGELFQASLALALGLADAVMNQSSGVHIDALFIDEGFGSLDEQSVERAIDLLDELRDRGAMVGVITHVPALLDALPLGISVVDAPDGNGSTIHQRRLAA